MSRFHLLTARSLEGNIPKFFLHNALYTFMLWMPIWVIYLQRDHGFSLTQVTFIDLAFWLTIAISEVPTGAAADTLGRKHSQLIGLLLSTVSVSLFALAPTFPVLLLANSLWAVAITFMSGADLAFFYDSLKAIGREGEYKRLRGRLATVTLASLAISSALGGLIAESSLVMPFLIYLVFLALSILVVLRFEEPPVDSHPETGAPPTYRQILSAAFDALRASANLRLTMLFAGFLPLFITIVSIIFIQPYALEIGLPIASLGLLIFGLRLVDMLASSSSDRIVARLGEWAWLKLAPLLVVLGLLGIALVPSLLGIIIYAMASFAVFVSRPLLEDILQRQTESSHRATILSVESLLRTLLLAFIEPLLGLAADARGLPFSFLLMAAGAALILVYLLLRWRKLFKALPS
ncbi:MAG: MFS transporter [Anaerolineae bacterium]|nr:MFS transporter [Anaerolineae bacterium]